MINVLYLIRKLRMIDTSIIGNSRENFDRRVSSRGAIVDPVDEATQLHDNRLKNAVTRYTSQGDFFDCTGGR